MQLEGMLFLLIMIIIIPIIYVFSNDTAFYIILSLVLSFSSIKNILKPFLPIDSEDDEETKELIQEFKDSINFDFNRIKLGIKTSKAMIIVLYFVYNCFFIDIFIYKITTTFIIVYWIRYIVENINNSQEHNNSPETQISFFDRSLTMLVNILSLVVILATAYNRFLR